MCRWVHLLVLGFSIASGLAATQLSASGALEVIQRLGESRAGEIQVVPGRSRQGESPIYYIRLPPTPYYFKHNSLKPAHAKHATVPVKFTNNGKPHRVHHWNLPLLHSKIFHPLLSTTHSHSATQIRPFHTSRIDNPLHSTRPLLALGGSSVPVKATENGFDSTSTANLHKISTEIETVSTTTTTHSTTTPMSTKTTTPISTTYPTTTSTTHPTTASTTSQTPPATPDTLSRHKSGGKGVVHLKKSYSYNGRPSSVYVWGPKHAAAARLKRPNQRFSMF